MTAVSLNLSSLQGELSRDPEFLLHIRHFTARIKVVIGERQSFMISVVDGSLVGIDPVVTPFDSYDIQLAGSDELWDLLLTPQPPAFYHDFYPAMVHHGFRIEGDMEMIMAFYPAIRRLGDIFRAVAGSEVPA
ncbi:hypothetical protein GCM10027445_30890 [Amycolatopsis endophytica]|uniref:SCP2 domain-containing protein n=1 Tax=Amycolatopsis endophytica TaxID=860233 RepID=A0A853BBR5_9PSEU|nr:hypothetical protein [Amycolatopsis endophytica]NYI91816.1 hypothetical protein [Amycolatopsis endophytica]